MGRAEISDAKQCESRVSACIALRELAPMPNLIYDFVPPSYTTRNPDYPFGILAITGIHMDIRTGQSASDSAAVLRIRSCSSKAPRSPARMAST
jgi:hypothetical protein